MFSDLLRGARTAVQSFSPLSAVRVVPVVEGAHIDCRGRYGRLLESELSMPRRNQFSVKKSSVRAIKPSAPLADDHPAILQKVSELLSLKFEIVGCVSDGVAAVAAARVVVMYFSVEFRPPA